MTARMPLTVLTAVPPLDGDPLSFSDLPDEQTARRRLQQEAEALRQAAGDLMDSPHGRRLLRWLLTACQCFEACEPGPQDSPAALHAREGRRVLGFRLLRLVREARPARVAQLLDPEENDV